VSVAGCPIVTNPFAGNEPYMVRQNNKSYARGTEAVKALKDDTKQLEDFKGYVRKSGDLDSNFSAEQKAVSAPSCDKDGHTGGADDKPNTKDTICWVFTDGRP
jgi:hypothetical protein